MTNIVVYTDNNSYQITTETNQTTNILLGQLKHLQRLPLRFSNFDNPYNYNINIAVKQLTEYAHKFDIVVDINQLNNQQYLNYLHKLYEQGYNGQREWLLYHEAIHMLEAINNNETAVDVRLTYGEASGPLDHRYAYSELLNCRRDLAVGDCYVSFSELGKTPYHYWREGEPDDLERFCQLSKPMLRLNFQLRICVSTPDLPSDIPKFEAWFAKYKEAWCKHWGIPDWTIDQMFGGIRIGHLDKITEFVAELRAEHVPVKLGLVDA